MFYLILSLYNKIKPKFAAESCGLECYQHLNFVFFFYLFGNFLKPCACLHCNQCDHIGIGQNISKRLWQQFFAQNP